MFSAQVLACRKACWAVGGDICPSICLMAAQSPSAQTPGQSGTAVSGVTTMRPLTRIVLDSNLRIPLSSQLVTTATERGNEVRVFTSASAMRDNRVKAKELEERAKPREVTITVYSTPITIQVEAAEKK